MKIEALEQIKHHPYYPGTSDQITVHDEVGQKWVDNGWAKNVDTGETGTRSNSPSTLHVDSVVHTSTSEVK